MKRRTLLQSLHVALLPAAAWLTLTPAHAGVADDFDKAIIRDDFVLMRQLLLKGVNPNLADAQGRPGLVKAVQLNSLRVAQELLKAPKIQIDAISQGGETALMHACIQGEIDLVRQLLARDARVNQPGWAPLHYAASADHANSTDIAALLLEHNAYIDAESPNKSTPLMLAAQYGSEAMVDLLLDAGADVHLRNQQGLSAVDFARRSEREFMVDKMDKAYQATRRPKASW